MRSIFYCGSFVFSCFISLSAQALIIEGTFTGDVIYAGDCVNESATPVADCTPLWANSVIGTSATGAFWYDTDLAPQDLSSLENMGYYFSYSNTWIKTEINIGNKNFVISDTLPSNDRFDVESILLIDSFDSAPDGSEKQYVSITDKTSASFLNGNYLTKSLSVTLETWNQRIITGDSLVQEYDWVDDGDQLQGSARFNFKSRDDEKLQIGDAYIRFTDFSMRIKGDVVVPEPASFSLLLIAMLTLWFRRNLRAFK